MFSTGHFAALFNKKPIVNLVASGLVLDWTCPTADFTTTAGVIDASPKARAASRYDNAVFDVVQFAPGDFRLKKVTTTIGGIGWADSDDFTFENDFDILVEGVRFGNAASGSSQAILSKLGGSNGHYSWQISINGTGVCQALLSTNGTSVTQTISSSVSANINDDFAFRLRRVNGVVTFGVQINNAVWTDTTINLATPLANGTTSLIAMARGDVAGNSVAQNTMIKRIRVSKGALIIPA